jgi:hypothetical protein
MFRSNLLNRRVVRDMIRYLYIVVDASRCGQEGLAKGGEFSLQNARKVAGIPMPSYDTT